MVEKKLPRSAEGKRLCIEPNHKRAQRLMRLMGLEAVCPKRSTSRPAPGHNVHPYLLRNMAVTKPDQVWASDITYIPLQHGVL